jgi:threonine dehydrogenase-like Zn-dependent dehydrogenase
MPRTMRAIRKVEPRAGLVLDEVPVPACGDDEVLVQVEAASVCGTDLHIHDRAKLPPEIATLQEPLGNAVFATGAGPGAGASSERRD